GVVEAGPSVGGTFQHAFDTLLDAEGTVRVLQRHLRIDRVLSRGGAGGWPSRCVTLTRYARWAAPHITVLPGGGVDGDALRALAACGSVVEAHVGRAARVGRAVEGRGSADAVRHLL